MRVYLDINSIHNLNMSMKQRSLSALKAKKHGDYFENLLMFFSHRSGFKFIKIPNGCKYLPNGRIVPIKSPFDFILSSDSMTLFIDAKSVEGESFSFSQINQDQVRCLDMVKNKNNKAGYIIDLNKEVIFADIDLLKSIKPGQSIKKEDGVYLGTTKEFSLEKLK